MPKKTLTTTNTVLHFWAFSFIIPTTATQNFNAITRRISKQPFFHPWDLLKQSLSAREWKLWTILQFSSANNAKILKKFCLCFLTRNLNSSMGQINQLLTSYLFWLLHCNKRGDHWFPQSIFVMPQSISFNCRIWSYKKL